MFCFNAFILFVGFDVSLLPYRLCFKPAACCYCCSAPTCCRLLPLGCCVTSPHDHLVFPLRLNAHRVAYRVWQAAAGLQLSDMFCYICCPLPVYTYVCSPLLITTPTVCSVLLFINASTTKPTSW